MGLGISVTVDGGRGTVDGRWGGGLCGWRETLQRIGKVTDWGSFYVLTSFPDLYYDICRSMLEIGKLFNS